MGLMGEEVEGENNHPDAPQSRFWESICSEDDKADHVEFIRLVSMGSDEDERTVTDIQLWTKFLKHFTTITVQGRGTYSITASASGEAYLAVALIRNVTGVSMANCGTDFENAKAAILARRASELAPSVNDEGAGNNGNASDAVGGNE